MTVLAAGAKLPALVSVAAGPEILGQSEAWLAVTAGTSWGSHTAGAAVESRAGELGLGAAPVSLVTPVRAVDLSVTDLAGWQTPGEVGTEEPALGQLTGLPLCQTVRLV